MARWIYRGPRSTDRILDRRPSPRQGFRLDFPDEPPTAIGTLFAAFAKGLKIRRP